MKFYSEEEVSQLESQWWKHIQPSCEENISLIKEWEQKYSEYQKYQESILAFKNWNAEYQLPLISKIFNGDEAFARKILAWAERKVKENDMDYCDNFRVADLNVEEQIKFYKKMQSQGCCGFFDEIIEIEGKTIMIGWNFGH